MKKFAKISLAAAVAVAGLSSVASAKPLEEAIKGVDATGYVTYQYNDKTDSAAGADLDSTVAGNQKNLQSNIYKAAITLSIPAADDVAVKVTGVARGSTRDADTNVATELAHANFTYTGVQNLTVIAGKQALNTPWTEGSSVINSTQNGTGVLALYNAGFATIAAGHFLNNSINGTTNSDTGVNVTDNDISVVAAIVPMGDIATAQVWYADIQSSDLGAATAALADGGNALSAAIDVNLMDVAKLNVRHSTLKGDQNNLAKQKLTKAVLSGAVGPVNLAAGYGKTGTNGGLVAFDGDADAGFKGWDVDLNNVPDADAYLLTANMNVLPSVNVALTHVNAEVDNVAGNWEETYAQVTYTHNKNLSAFVRLGTETDDLGGTKTSDQDKGRLQVGYKF